MFQKKVLKNNFLYVKNYQKLSKNYFSFSYTQSALLRYVAPEVIGVRFADVAADPFVAIGLRYFVMQAATSEHPAVPKRSKGDIPVFEMVPSLHPSPDSG